MFDGQAVISCNSDGKSRLDELALLMDDMRRDRVLKLKSYETLVNIARVLICHEFNDGKLDIKREDDELLAFMSYITRGYYKDPKGAILRFYNVPDNVIVGDYRYGHQLTDD